MPCNESGVENLGGLFSKSDVKKIDCIKDVV